VAAYCIIIFILLLFDRTLNNFNRALYSSFYTTIEYVAFSYIISEIIQQRKIRVLIFFLSILFVLFEIYYYFSGNIKYIDSIPIGVETILILLYTLYLFYEQFQKIETAYIYNSYWFWLVIGIVFYLSTSFFFNILANNNYRTARQWWHLTYIFEIIKNVLFVIGLISFSKKHSDNNKNSASIPYLDMML
jgi:hypothetical protein